MGLANASGFNITSANESINLSGGLDPRLAVNEQAHEIFREAYRQALFQVSFVLSLFLLSYLVEIGLLVASHVADMPDTWYTDRLPSLRQELWAFRLGLSILLVAQMVFGGALI
ncbi:MAG: hypothetical protein SVW02_04260 [Candidatus Nanohaloarchaea archaeon]|nr:hypothetical protein [Candidatus Nanohaloarchaea archaeon]